MPLADTDLFVIQDVTNKKFYKLQLLDLLSHIEAGPSINFRGSVDLSQPPSASGVDPATADNGDVYLVEADVNPINAGWDMQNGDTIAYANDRIVYSSATSQWILISIGINPDDYVNRSGDNMLGNLTFATDKITLRTDGSATFTGETTVGAYPWAGNAIGTMLTPVGSLVATAEGSNNIFWGFQPGSSDSTSRISADGSAAFGTGRLSISSDGTIDIQAVDSSADASVLFRAGSANLTAGAEAFKLTANGNASFGNNAIELNIAQGGRVNADFGMVAGGYNSVTDSNGVYVQGNDTTNGGRVSIQSSTTTSNYASFSILKGTEQKATISNDGSATFAGRVDVAPEGADIDKDYVSLLSDGAVFVRTYSKGDSDYVWRGNKELTETSRINVDGSATFAGPLEAESIDGGTF